MFVPRGHMVEYAAAVKRAVNVPVIAVGRLDDPELAAEGRRRRRRGPRAARPRADRRARLAAARSRRAASTSCGRASRATPASTSSAAASAPAARSTPRPGASSSGRSCRPPSARRVMVDRQSGPAGMEAARIARIRGHDVSIWERDEQLGGKLEVAGLAPSKREVLRFRDHQSNRLAELGVEIHLNSEVTPEVVAAEAPDVVIVAIGAEPIDPADPGHRRRRWCTTRKRFLRGDVAVARGRARRRDRRQRHRLRDRRAPDRRGRRRDDHRDAPGRRLRHRGDHPPPPHPRAQAAAASRSSPAPR